MSTRRSAVVALTLALTVVGALAEGMQWRELSQQQRAVLAPLEREWTGIDEPRKRKWLELAERLPRMSPDERQRVQGRMAEWSRLSPDERVQARQRYQQSRALSTEERQQRWEAYQALPPERRRELATQQQLPPPAAPRAAPATRERQKSNLVPNPAHGAPPKVVGPTVQQARPGASTTSISRSPAPPPHQQTGLPKIAATPGFVDRATLLPQRGPQGAATTRPEPAARSKN